MIDNRHRVTAQPPRSAAPIEIVCERTIHDPAPPALTFPSIKVEAEPEPEAQADHDQ